MNCGTIVTHDNAFLRQWFKVVFRFEVPNAKERRSTERNTSVRETLEQSYWHSNFPLPIDTLTNTSRPFTNFLTAFSWCSSPLHSLVSCTPPQSLSFHGRYYYVTFAKQSDCSANIPAERTKTEYSVHQTIFPLRMRKMVWEQD